MGDVEARMSDRIRMDMVTTSSVQLLGLISCTAGLVCQTALEQGHAGRMALGYRGCRSGSVDSSRMRRASDANGLSNKALLSRLRGCEGSERRRDEARRRQSEFQFPDPAALSDESTSVNSLRQRETDKIISRKKE